MKDRSIGQYHTIIDFFYYIIQYVMPNHYIHFMCLVFSFVFSKILCFLSDFFHSIYMKRHKLGNAQVFCILDKYNILPNV